MVPPHAVDTVPANPYWPSAAMNAVAAASGRPSPGPQPDSGPAWQTVRQPANPKDGDLRHRTFRWLATLPADVRPLATGRQYPRIVNRIGDLWGHCEYTRLHFQSLLIDRRKGRRGFPPAVRKELETLQQYYFEHLSGLPAILWNAIPVDPPKIPQKVFSCRQDRSDIDILPP